jgi:iron(III) transport system substrate-binding protein
MRRLWLLLLLVGCRIEVGAPRSSESGSEATSGTIWVYTSAYRPVVDDLDALVRAKLNGVRVEWFTAGSEKIAARIDAELTAGGSRADVVLTSDPFFYARLKREGLLLPYVPPPALRLPKRLVDADGAWITTRVSTMVLVYNTKILTRERAPKSFLDLAAPELSGKIILGDPLSSGTFFTTIAVLDDHFGPSYFEALRDRHAISTGGNSTVLDRVAGGEFAAGICLLENVLQAKRKGAPVDFVLPGEGPVLIPGPEAILKSSAHPALARAFVDLLMSPEGQAVMVRGDLHSPDPRVPGPDGAPSFSDLDRRAIPWEAGLFDRTATSVAELRERFQKTVQK